MDFDCRQNYRNNNDEFIHHDACVQTMCAPEKLLVWPRVNLGRRPVFS